jgi:hypothetical protein
MQKFRFKIAIPWNVTDASFDCLPYSTLYRSIPSISSQEDLDESQADVARLVHNVTTGANRTGFSLTLLYFVSFLLSSLNSSLKKFEKKHSFTRWREFDREFEHASSSVRLKSLHCLREAAVEYNFMLGLKPKYSSEYWYLLYKCNGPTLQKKKLTAPWFLFNPHSCIALIPFNFSLRGSILGKEDSTTDCSHQWPS